MVLWLQQGGVLRGEVEMKIKTSELIGLALDWAVAKCAGVAVKYKDPMLPAGIFKVIGESWYKKHVKYSPSTDWDVGGPIIEKHAIGVAQYGPNDTWKAAIGITPYGCAYGPTPLVAAMRTFVASKMGDEVEIPEELCK